MIYLTLPELLHIAARVLGSDHAIRDIGLLEAALARPQATAFGDCLPVSDRDHHAVCLEEDDIVRCLAGRRQPMAS